MRESGYFGERATVRPPKPQPISAIETRFVKVVVVFVGGEVESMKAGKCVDQSICDG